MGFMDKIRNMVNATEEDDYEQEYNMAPNESSFEDVSSSSVQREKQAKVTSIRGSGNASNLHVVLVKPESFQEAATIADHLNSKHTVVLNLETTDRDAARRLVDFLSGAAYANGGQMKRVANSTFIITPFNVDVMGDLLLDELESSGMYL